MSDLPKVIYVMGPPGAGKGTQAELLAHELKYHRFSSGDAFRAISRQDTDLGRKVKETIDNGYLAPPEMAAEVVTTAVKDHMSQGHGLIFDGSPRTVKEAEMIDAFFAEQGYGKPLAIYLHVDRDEMIRRNSQRKFCLDIHNDFPVVDEEDVQRCEGLGGRIGIRPDDEPEKFTTRWDEFQKQTYPVIERYLSEGVAHQLDGMRPIQEVHMSVMKLIEELKKK
ncbi:MAG: nucleoside monophosphate kinase [Candidatus Andersenbacteria bacterium]